VVAGGPAALWSDEGYELLVDRFAPIYDELVERLEPRPGVRWLDVATGSGEAAIRAAQAGADVVGIDIAPGMIERASRKAEGLGATFDVGDAQRLPYADGSFDVVSSNFGVIFAPDPHRAARELARVAAPGARLGLTAWREPIELTEIYARYSPGTPPPLDAWGSEEALDRLLGADFNLIFEQRVWHLEGRSPEAVYDFMTQAAPPLKALVGVLDDDVRAGLRGDLVEYWRGFAHDGGVDEPRAYVLAIGRRR
jgi:SAM-dependent methyltransferase